MCSSRTAFAFSAVAALLVAAISFSFCLALVHQHVAGQVDSVSCLLSDRKARVERTGPTLKRTLTAASSLSAGARTAHVRRRNVIIGICSSASLLVVLAVVLAVVLMGLKKPGEPGASSSENADAGTRPSPAGANGLDGKTSITVCSAVGGVVLLCLCLGLGYCVLKKRAARDTVENDSAEEVVCGKYTVTRGLCNRSHNMCFYNSALQCLFRMSDLFAGRGPEFSEFDAMLHRIFLEMASKSKTPYDASHFFGHVDSVVPWLGGGSRSTWPNQLDALTEVPSLSPLFRFAFKYSCRECGSCLESGFHGSLRLWRLQLPTDSGMPLVTNNLYAFLDKLPKNIYCNHCGVEVAAQISITDTSEILLLALCRNDEMMVGRDNVMLADNIVINDKRYELVGAIFDIEFSLFIGHVYAKIPLDNNAVLIADDSRVKVRERTEEEFYDMSFAFYRKVG